jgi:hypothetical protein
MEKRWWDMEPERRRESREMARTEIYSTKLEEEAGTN